MANNLGGRNEKRTAGYLFIGHPSNCGCHYCILAGGSGDAKVKPAPGVPASFISHSDVHAGTIIEVVHDRRITWRRDKAVLLNGVESDAPDKLVCNAGGFAAHISGKQRYRYFYNPEAELITFTLRKSADGIYRWRKVGDNARGHTQHLIIGLKHEHYDFNF